MPEQIQTRRTTGVILPSGEELPGLGLSIGGAGLDPRRRAEGVASLRTGLDLGLTVIDAAEAEEPVAEALQGRGDDVFLIGRLEPRRLAPQRAIRDGILTACQESLRRLGTDRIDLYLCHRRGSVPLEDVVAGINMLMTEGLIRHWGVADFDIPDLVALTAVPGGTAVEADQVGYDLFHREIEWDLLPRCRAARLPVLARVAPESEDRTAGRNAGRDAAAADAALTAVARRRGATPGQVGLAWLLHQDGVYAMVGADTPERVRQRHAALELTLTEEDLAELDRAFPPRSGPRPPAGIPGPPPSEA